MSAAGLELEAALAAAARDLAAAGIEAPRREARLLAAQVLGARPERLLGRPEGRLDATAAERLAEAVGRRAAHAPLAHLVGAREFWSLAFRVGPEVLTPRPDSETLIEAALAAVPDRAAPLRLLDLGTGSGCLLVALLRELPAAVGIGVDASPAAIRLARDNAGRLGVGDRAGFLVGDWTAALGGRFDLVVANPPYIATPDLAALAPEVRDHEPLLALDGGEDGLDAYRALLPQLARLLAPGGRAFLELGAGQADAVEALAREAGLLPVGRRCDLAGVVRCIALRPGPSPREKGLGESAPLA